ncbi:D-glycerate dehydrogenase [Candidatus Woesearchaeota archaeon]|nr:D-glycerate dehydrogenase [Candidatus Woesearchaeota archaeon]
MKPRVFVSRHFPGEGIALLKKSCDVRIGVMKGTCPRKKLLQGAKWADAIVTLLTDKVDAEVYDQNPRLKIVANYAVGFDNIDLAEATKRGVLVTNTPGAQTESVAEHAIGLMMVLGKRIREADAFMRAGKYKGWDPDLLLGTEFDGKVCGVIGVGRIGSIFVKFAKALGMSIIYNDVVRSPDIEQKYDAKPVDINTLLKQCDVISIHVPLMPSTRHLINAGHLKLMKKTAFLINTSRGPVIDETALVSALKRRQIGGAGLDVYEFEPKLVPGLAKLDNVVLTPHIASATWEARDSMSRIAAQCVLAAFKGEVPEALVNKDVLQKNPWIKTGA